MAKRTWGVRPDETGTVSRDALIAALIDGATMLDIAGGCLEVVVGRAPTDMPGEMVTTGVALCWKDRTNATAAPEQSVTVTPAEAHTEIEVDDAELGEDILASPIAQAVAPTPENPDGFDYSAMPDEDLDESTVPAA